MSSSIRQSILYSQNFLRDSCLVTSLIAQSTIGRDDVVYEIGPGKGIITEQLALRSKRVVAIEKDPRLSTLLLQKFVDSPNVIIHPGDFLHYPLPHKPYKVFANIPFNITTAIVNRLTGAECPPEEAYLIMQREAAEMFSGASCETLRAILLKPWFEVTIVHHFKRKDFVPAPRVDVVMLRLRKRGPPLVQNEDRQRFRDFVTYTFTSWRPTLEATLKGVFSRPQLKYIRRILKIDLDRSPTSLPFGQWLHLFEYFKTVRNEDAKQVIVGSEKRLIQQQNKLKKIYRTRQNK